MDGIVRQRSSAAGSDSAVVIALLLVLAAGRATLAAPDLVRMIEAEGVAAKYWPRWRGPSGQGLVADGPYPDRWSSRDNISWRVPVAGRGNSSPVIWDDRIFLTTAYDGGQRQSMLAYRRTDGRLLWETFVPTPRGVEFGHPKNGHASATPATDGRRIYASFGSNGLMAVDLNGKVAWHRPIGRLANYHGSAGSPVLYKDRLFIYQDHDGGDTGGSFVAAFETETGKPLWQTPRHASVGWGTPVVITAGGRDELIVSSQRRVQAYDPMSGKELWAVTGNTYEVIPTPVVGHGLVYCASGRAGPTMAIRPGGSGDVTATHVAWSVAKGSPFVPSPLLVGDVLYLVNDMQSIVTAYEAKTGALLFQGRLGSERREGFSASPVAVNGHVFITNDDGETFVLKAGRTFELSHVNQLGEPVLASPALVDGRWYFRTASSLVAIGATQ
jgi:outer membrane protein assembly factor BamB